jgi:hypothetical protein
VNLGIGGGRLGADHQRQEDDDPSSHHAGHASRWSIAPFSR